MATNHLFFWVGGGWETLLTPTSNISCTRATMITMTLREKKRSLQPTAEAGDLTEIALGQVLRLLFGLLPGSNSSFIAVRAATEGSLLKRLGGGQPPSFPWHARPQSHEIQDFLSNSH